MLFQHKDKNKILNNNFSNLDELIDYLILEKGSLYELQQGNIGIHGDDEDAVKIRYFKSLNYILDIQLLRQFQYVLKMRIILLNNIAPLPLVDKMRPIVVMSFIPTLTWYIQDSWIN